MTFTEKLDMLMEARGLTRGGLAEATGIPYNTIVGFYTKGYSNIKLSNLRRLAEFFSVSVDALSDDGRGLETEPARGGEMAKKYSALSEKGRDIVDGVIDGLLELSAAPERKPARVEYIKEYITPAAAGYASPAEGEDYVLVPRAAGTPAEADFAVRIAGDSMEPYIMDGSRAYVARGTGLNDGDVGIFFVDGDMKCKQYCEDSFGNIYLFSLNRARRDADVTVPADSGVTVFCFGRVLLPRRPPLPKD